MSHHTDACRMHPKSKMMSHHKDACCMMRYLMMHRGKSMMMRVCPSTVLLPRTSHSTPPIDSHVSDPTQSFDLIAPVRVGEARGCDPDYIYSYQAVDEGIEVPTQAGLQANPGVRCWKAHVEANRFEAAGGSDTTLNCWEQIESHIGPGTARHWDFLNQASCDEVCPDVCSPTSLIVHPVLDIIEQCCAPLRAGTDPATVHCNDDVMLYHASWEIHDDNQPSWESHGDEQSLWENHDDDQSVWEILLLDIVLSLVLLFVQSQHHVTTMLMPPNSAALPCALVVTQPLFIARMASCCILLKSQKTTVRTHHVTTSIMMRSMKHNVTIRNTRILHHATVRINVCRIQHPMPIVLYTVLLCICPSQIKLHVK